MRLLIVSLLLLLPGCGLFIDEIGADGSALKVENVCNVLVSQKALTTEGDDSAVVERIRVNPDCTTEIDVRQAVGDGVTGSVIEQ